MVEALQKNSNDVLTVVYNKPMLFRAEQSRAEQSRAWANCALFASCGSEAFEIEYRIRDG